MKARILNVIRGAEHCYNPGDIVHGDTAKRFVAAHAAVEIKQEAEQFEVVDEIEPATAEPVIKQPVQHNKTSKFNRKG